MNRRRFLTLAASGTVAGITGPTFGRGPGAAAPPVDAEAELVCSAWVHARAVGKPLLVFVFPKRSKHWNERGELFGHWLNRGSRRGMAELSLVEVVCATNRSVRRAFPQLRNAAGAEPPLMWLIETDSESRKGAVAQGLSTERTTVPGLFQDGEGSRRSGVQERTMRLEALLRTYLVGDSDCLEARCQQASSALRAEERARLDELLDADRPLPIGLADRGAARVLHAASRSPQLDHDLLDLLAEVSVQRLRNVAPHGARWAQDLGCGSLHVERADPSESMYFLCGAAFVPEESRRFLYFYAKS